MAAPLAAALSWVAFRPSEAPPPPAFAPAPPKMAPRQMTPRDPVTVASAPAEAPPTPPAGSPSAQKLGMIPGFAELPETHRPEAMRALAGQIEGKLAKGGGASLGALDCEAVPCLLHVTWPAGKAGFAARADVLAVATELGPGRLTAFPVGQDAGAASEEMLLAWVPEDRPELGSSFQLEALRRTQGLPEEAP